MNLYPGASIDVGTTRAPVPAASPASRIEAGAISASQLVPNSVLTYADFKAVASMDPEFFAAPERVLPMVRHWTRDDLYTLGNALMAEGDRRIPGELVAVLRALVAADPDIPEPETPTHVEFVTNPNYDDGVFWDDETVYVHIAGCDDPVLIGFTAEDDGSPEAAEGLALEERFRALLADYSRTDPPAHGAHLVVDLSTGEFEHSGKWSLL
ncbi:hypothetical protein KUF83_30275 [Streptomyces sp. BV286]|uniref:hypothetical protein n=1 Tax=Streptomyces sp. BV286 TaxID=2849672 RepID=UPI001C2ED3D5|nr:hypothetical protein [Streptomyces sp. BV286]MBV1940823.1 hypothetical protein [Streptomyces sp. BV286]